MTWAYAKKGIESGSFRKNYETYYGSNQDTMYRDITDTARTTVRDSGLFSFYVPTARPFRTPGAVMPGTGSTGTAST